MRLTRQLLLIPLLALATACIGLQAKQDLTSVDAGAYELEQAHASLVWRVKHQGLSWYTARFTDIEASLDFNPDNPTASRIEAIIDPRSVSAEHPTETDWNDRIAEDMFKAEEFPQIVFKSTSATTTGEFTGEVTGDLTFMGVTKPVTLNVTYNGAIGSSALHGGRGLVGFSANTTLNRSDFGLTRYARFVGDEVQVIIEVEFVEAGASAD